MSRHILTFARQLGLSERQEIISEANDLYRKVSGCTTLGSLGLTASAQVGCNKF